MEMEHMIPGWRASGPDLLTYLVRCECMDSTL